MNTTRNIPIAQGSVECVTGWCLNWFGRWGMRFLLKGAAHGDPAPVGSGDSLAIGTSFELVRFGGTSKRRKKVGGDEDDDHDNDESKKPKSPSPSRPRSRHLACPYSKHDPEKYMMCVGHTWPTVSRLKTDHIYRHHRFMGIQCQRCGGLVRAGAERLHADCEPRAFVEMEGVNSLMMDELRSKAIARGGSEEQKWHAVYSILFPLVPRNSHPNPYFEPLPEMLRAAYTSLRAEALMPHIIQAHPIIPGAVAEYAVDSPQTALEPRPSEDLMGGPDHPTVFPKQHGWARHQQPGGHTNQAMSLYADDSFAGRPSLDANVNESVGNAAIASATNDWGDLLFSDQELNDLIAEYTQ
ncbi:hypothetical protein F5Y04DRAFT_254957 [Hypomontagnella monticulosa]|nr:hypothetical protein F5Y04DRAFT_254957 [Hypomontagnella monticulosa]